MSLDRCLPQVLLRENKWRGTNHLIILGFFVLCVSILFLTGGNIERLAAVYALSFLSVMALFAIGNLLLKRKRNRLPRTVRAPVAAVIGALIAVLIALVGNVLLDPGNVLIFMAYFAAALAVIAVMFKRLVLMRWALVASKVVVDFFIAFNAKLGVWISRKVTAINSLSVVYFTRGDNFEVLDSAARYVLSNEQTNQLKVIHVYANEADIPPNLAQQLVTLDHQYPQLRIDFLAVRGEFTPALIEQLSLLLNVPKNMMFIGTPGDRFTHRIEKLGGVRVIL